MTDPKFEHKKFDKIYRYQEQKVVVCEKIDGTNGLIFIDEETDTMLIGSRNRWIDHHNDNYGFHKWCMENEEELRKLGPGHHYGEWWGQGIQRRYDMDQKVFSLFNAPRWEGNPDKPECCDVVPIVFTGTQSEYDIEFETNLKFNPSVAAERYGVYFENIEGYVIWLAGTQKYMKHILSK